MKLFLDSGAFSVWNMGKEISINSYIEFCKKYQSELDIIATLDVIPGAPNKTLTPQIVESAAKRGYRNYLKMMKDGVEQEKLLHTYHQGDPEKWLEKLVSEGGSYIGVSPANDKTTNQRKIWLDTICMPILLDSKQKPKVRFHGFAVTSLKLVFNYPWYSVDSSSWRLRGGGFGLIDLPTNPVRLKTKDDYQILSLPISKGVKKHQTSAESMGLFAINQVTQSTVSFNKYPILFRKAVEELLDKYKFTLKELEEDHMKRSIWNALYLITSIDKFTNTTLFLATGDIGSVILLKEKMIELGISLDKLNVLVSYALISKKDNTSTILENLIKLKNECK